MSDGFFGEQDEKVKYETGLPNLGTYMALFHFLTPLMPTQKKILTPFQMLLFRAPSIGSACATPSSSVSHFPKDSVQNIQWNGVFFICKREAFDCMARERHSAHNYASPVGGGLWTQSGSHYRLFWNFHWETIKSESTCPNVFQLQAQSHYEVLNRYYTQGSHLFWFWFLILFY